MKNMNLHEGVPEEYERFYQEENLIKAV